ncbi:MAG: TetR/AcrR family transcriptional regulator [Anaerolineae bacterium]
MPKQTLRGDSRRQELILAAYRLIAEQGFEGLRVRDVAEQVNVNIATLHYYFPTKEDLVSGVVDYLLHLFLTVEAPKPQVGELSARQTLRQIFADLRFQLETAPEMFIVLNELHLHSQRDSGIRAVLAKLNDGWHAHIEGVCQQGIETREFRSDLQPNLAASLVIGLIKGISLQATTQLDTFDLDQIASEVERWFSR